MILPIWKDHLVSFGNKQSVEYRICYKNGNTLTPIYSGKAYARPGADRITIRINDICADWLVNSFPSLSKAFNREDLPVEFVVQEVTEMGQYNEVESVRFLNDWSYDDHHDAEKDGLAAPINGIIGRGQWLMVSVLDKDAVELTITLADDSSYKVIIPVAISSDFNEDFNQDFAKSLLAAGSGTAVISSAILGDAVKVSVLGKEYQVVDCSRYVLYYLNAYGGWDSFLIEGVTSERDDLTRHSMNISGEFKRQTDNYLNEIKKSFTMNTSWLNDDESLRMHHLLNSTDVYMHDMDKGIILPVTIENSETQYKTFRSNGCKLSNYAIEVKVAQTRMRR